VRLKFNPGYFAAFLFLGSALVAPSTSWALCVTTSSTNLRAGPGPKHPITWKVGKYTPLVEIRKSGNWYEVEDMDGEKHWVYAPNTSRKMVCVAVKVTTARIRKGPGAQAELAELRQVDRYTPFKRLDVQEEWAEVEAPWGETYWMHESTLWRPVKVARVNF
jgi:SH3-like domain-containing protein